MRPSERGLQWHRRGLAAGPVHTTQLTTSRTQREPIIEKTELLSTVSHKSRPPLVSPYNSPMRACKTCDQICLYYTHRYLAILFYLGLHVIFTFCTCNFLQNKYLCIHIYVSFQWDDCTSLQRVYSGYVCVTVHLIKYQIKLNIKYFYLTSVLQWKTECLNDMQACGTQCNQCLNQICKGTGSSKSLDHTCTFSNPLHEIHSMSMHYVYTVCLRWFVPSTHRRCRRPLREGRTWTVLTPLCLS